MPRAAAATSPGFSTPRTHTTPSAASLRETARPMPVPAPPITTVLPEAMPLPYGLAAEPGVGRRLVHQPSRRPVEKLLVGCGRPGRADQVAVPGQEQLGAPPLRVVEFLDQSNNAAHRSQQDRWQVRQQAAGTLLDPVHGSLLASWAAFATRPGASAARA